MTKIGIAMALGMAVSVLQPVQGTASGESALIALQASRQVERVALPGPRNGGRELVLTQLAPAVNAWLLLSVPAAGGRDVRSFHLENPDPEHQRVALDPAEPGTLVLRRDDAAARCVIWPATELVRAASTRLPYAPLCGGRLFLRNAVPGNRSALEAMTGFLRDHVWQGEQVISWVKGEFFRDHFVERADPGVPGGASVAALPGAPPPARVRGGQPLQPIVPSSLGIALAPGEKRALLPGHWAGAAHLDGVWISAAAPGALADGLDPVESQALAFFVAFDLAGFELGFSLGTEHPRLGWSSRTRPPLRDDTLPGPDGFDRAAPLVRTGVLSPALLDQVVATFTGGFKREHGAFRYGALAQKNRGSHYGFVEQGVILSRLQAGLATLLVTRSGAVEMRTWSATDDQVIGTPRHARQNGVALVEPGPGGTPTVGPLVEQWGAGNWSGSADEQLRTLRAGACVLAHEGRRFLVYGYFSSATPRAMARVFLAYGCRYAMLLDMNALEHTYLALYPRSGSRMGVQHLVSGMATLDRTVAGALLPRFLGFSDDRDFFYITRRKGH